MLKKRIIPCLDVDRGRVVKGTRFKELRDAGDPVALAAFYERQGADELVFLDITASHENRNITLDMVRAVAEQISIPFTVGGAIRNVDDIRRLLMAGADKVAINTAAVNDPALIARASQLFGSQCIVVAIDAKRESNKWTVFTHGGRRATNMDAVAWAAECAQRGAGEILLTSIDRDGTKLGYNIALTKEVSDRVSVPVIASGGVGTLEHFVEVFQQGRADAALGASVFHFGEYSIHDVKETLARTGIPVRNPLNKEKQ